MGALFSRPNCEGGAPAGTACRASTLNPPISNMAIRCGVWALAGLAVLTTAMTLCAAEPSFKNDVFPILRDNCLACHSAQAKMGELVMEDYDGLMLGGKSGKPIVPGDSDSSLLIRMLDGRAQPKMPFGGGDLPPQNLAVLKSWIDAGAKGEEVTAGGPSLAAIKSRVKVSAPIAALAFSPDGQQLVLGRFRQVQVLDAATGSVTFTLDGHADLVRALAFSPDGQFLATAGGAPAEYGEVKIWDLGSREAARTIRGHSDCIYAVDFSSDGKRLVTGSYDKLIELWDASTGEKVKTLKDHVDAVYAVDFGAQATDLLSGAGDRSVKLWQLETGKPSLTLSEPLAGVLSVSFHPSARRIAAAGADKTIRTWEITSEQNSEARLIKAMTGHEGSILKIVYSPDGETLASSSTDRTLKVWDSTTLEEKHILGGQPDWAAALAYSPDGSTLVVGRYDGSVTFYETEFYEEQRTLWRAPEVTAEAR